MTVGGRFFALITFCLIVFPALLLSPGSALAQGDLIRVDAKGPVDVRADEVGYDERSTTYTAKGEVEVARGGTRIFADLVRLNSQTLIAEAEGKVRVTSSDHVLTGERMVIDLQNGTGKVYRGMVFVRTSHYYLRGDEIEKTGRDTYHLNKGSFTTCDGSNPAWQVTGQDMNVTLEGYGTAKNTAMRVRNVPILWSPYLVFPAKFKRQSGLLSPQFGSSSLHGLMLSVPYYQTLGESQDMTITANYLSKRGLDLGLEYRYHTAPGSKGMFMIDYLHHDSMGEELYNDGSNAEPYGSRYWFRGMADHSLFGGNATLKVDIDLVSDQDYLREFTFGHTGFDNTDNRFIKWFGRELDPNTSLTRQSTVNLQRSWSNATFNGSLLYTDDLSTDNKRTLQEFPFLSFDATRQPVGESGFYFQMGSSYRYYYRDEGSTGHISDLSPSISLPLNFNDFLSLEPVFTYKPRLYSVTHDDGETNGSTQGITNLWSFETSASTYLYRIFELGSGDDPLKIKHAMRPFVSYYFQPKVDNEVASLADTDQDRENTISYGIENAFTYKIMAKDEKTGEILPYYREFLRFNVNHSFNLSQYRRDQNEQYWGLVEGRLEFEPNQFIYAQTVAYWNLYNNTWDTINFEVNASDRRGDAIYLDFQQDSSGVHQLQSRLKLAVTDEWSLNYLNRHDFEGDQDFETTYEVRYEGQCWGIRFFFTDSVRERGYYVAFSLGGFGEILGYGRTAND